MIEIITENDCKRFWGKRVGIAVDNWGSNRSQKKLFWYFGNLIEISDGALKISTKDGFRMVDLSDIKEIKEASF